MIIRRANDNDREGVLSLLSQVLDIHSSGRPDIFKKGTVKYTGEELSAIFADDSRPVFVAEEDGNILGYCFCIFKQEKNSNILTDIKTLYIDDLCVDGNARGQGIGRALYDFSLDFAREQKCYNVTLNVWTLNGDALKFYEKMGLSPQKVVMEKIL